MKKITYTQLINKTIELYLEEKYLDAYNFITENCDGIKGNIAQIYNFRYAIGCKAGLTEKAMEIMEEAIVEKNYWYSYEYLMEDDDLKPLHVYNKFYELVNLCKKREIADQRDSKPCLKIIENNHDGSNGEKPLLIALHGNQENISITEDYWKCSATNDMMVALPQSSQIEFSEGYSWDDLILGSEELKNHYDKMLNDYNMDPSNIIIGGFSAGARVSLYSILNNLIDVKGFIFVGPWLPEIDEWEVLLEVLKSKNIKGYIICGDRDEDCFEDTKKFVDMLNQRDIKNVFKIVKDLDHDYPENFHDELELGIKFISK